MHDNVVSLPSHIVLWSISTIDRTIVQTKYFCKTISYYITFFAFNWYLPVILCLYLDQMFSCFVCQFILVTCINTNICFWMQILIHTICMSVCLTIARILSFISGTSIWLYVNGFMLYILYLPSVVCYMPLLVLRMRCAFMSAQKEIYNANKIGNDDDILPTIYYGGYKPHAISYVDIKDYITADEICKGELATSNFQYLDHLDASNSKKYTDKQHIHVHLPLHILAGLVPLGICRSIAAIHDIAAGSHTTLPMMKSLFKEHTCDKCVSCLTIFAMQPSKNQCKKIQRKKAESMKTEEQKDLEREKT